jgi:hypothetical protein
LSEVCVFCGDRYVNYMNYCVMCGRVQPSPPLTPKSKSRTSKKSPRSRRLTKEQQQTLLTEIQHGIAAGDLDMQTLSEKYGVSRSAVAYWRKKVDTQ